MNDYIILVDDNNQPIGKANKLNTHTKNTPLHRGFSVFLFNNRGQLLLQQRSEKKKTWPLVWSNSCCGHPILNESPKDAAKRRLQYELGINDAEIHIVLPGYRYRFEKDGVVENEFCPVMVAFSDQEPKLNPDEVKEIRWVKWSDWLKEISQNPKEYSQWCVEEAILLSQNPKLQEFLDIHNAKRKLQSK